MVEKEEKRGCVYFFKHVGLTPIKIGFSSNESPLGRFEQFKTYAPYGAELIGFIRTSEPLKLETLLHSKHASQRLMGEWFEISIEQVKNDIELFSNISDIEDKNNFELEWCRKIEEEVVFFKGFEKNDHMEVTLRALNHDENFNRTELAQKLGVSRMTIVRNVREIQKNIEIQALKNAEYVTIKKSKE